jgi:Predicted flavin-nucleotide-binding protein
MLGTLSNTQIEHVLHRNLYGRLGYLSDGRIHIVPIAFAYRNNRIYAQSKVGQKIESMRLNPKVSFQVDEIDNMANWRSVLCWGTYVEITDPEEQEAVFSELQDRLAPVVTSESTRKPPKNSDPPFIVKKKLRPVVFAIEIAEHTGRFEKSGR